MIELLQMALGHVDNNLKFKNAMEKAKKIIIGTLLIFFGIVLIDYVIEVLFRGTEFGIWKAYITSLNVWLTRLIISIALAFYNVWKQEKRSNSQKVE